MSCKKTDEEKSFEDVKSKLIDFIENNLYKFLLDQRFQETSNQKRIEEITLYAIEVQEIVGKWQKTKSIKEYTIEKVLYEHVIEAEKQE
ncbi:MAG: hypothetical protein ACXAC8_16310 [Candidatus Hodarchaeales archaeon]